MSRRRRQPIRFKGRQSFSYNRNFYFNWKTTDRALIRNCPPKRNALDFVREGVGRGERITRVRRDFILRPINIHKANWPDCELNGYFFLFELFNIIYNGRLAFLIFNSIPRDPLAAGDPVIPAVRLKQIPVIRPSIKMTKYVLPIRIENRLWNVQNRNFLFLF